MLTDTHRTAIEEILAKYPAEHKRSAVMPLLFLAQSEYGHLSEAAIDEVASLVDLESTQVASLVGFYTLFHDEPGGVHKMQICTDLPCALRGAERFAEDVCEALGIAMGGTTTDGVVTVETVKCLAACDAAPMFQVQSSDGIHYHEYQTVDSAIHTLRELGWNDSALGVAGTGEEGADAEPASATAPEASADD